MTEKDLLIQEQRREIESLKEEIVELKKLVDGYEISMRTVIERLDALNEALHKRLA